ncbi:MAG: diaminopimelate epimerase [Clostridia bacterium]|nr:diaminopimelate epimerase [Clostridia bacterium]
MEIQFAKINPTQNMTIIVLSPVERALQPQLAEKLMAYESVNAEQVGFLEEATLPGARARLQMMGGEFCGNATMSLAAYFAHKDGLAEAVPASCTLEISGAAEPLVCDIMKKGGAYRASVAMPLPEKIENLSLPGGSVYPAVFFPGIVHLIVPAGEMDAETAERAAKDWCAYLNADALGILLVNEGLSEIRPIVYVRATDSGVWERGCGSGSAAIGAYLAYKEQKNIAADIIQPGGVITAEAAWCKNSLSSLRIRSDVRISAIGTAWVE